jgi:hypothetical protein
MAQLQVRGDLFKNVRFQTVMTGLWGGTPEDTREGGVFDLDRVFQNISPSFEIEEAYLDFFFDSFDFRLGKQKFAWGKLDGTQPNNLLNPEKFYDLVFLEENDRKIGVPAIQGSYFPRFWEGQNLLQDLRLTAVWIPFHIPFRSPKEGERWFPPLSLPPRTTQVAGFEVGIDFRTRNTFPPDRQFGNGNFAFRLSGLSKGVDWALYYYNGYDPQRIFDLHITASAFPGPEGPLPITIGSDITLIPAFRRIQAFGADAAFTLGEFTFRGEGAFLKARPLSRSVVELIRNPSPEISASIDSVLQALLRGERNVLVDLDRPFVRRDAIEWGFGMDYAYKGWLPLFQVNQTVVLNNDTDLIINDIETRLVANLRKRFLQDRLEAQFTALYGIEGEYFRVIPRFTYDIRDDLEVQIGYFLIGGDPKSALGQFHQNDEVLLRVRYSF